MTTRDVDVVVLGLGPGGEHAAIKLGRAGLDVVAVESRLVGGECPYYGCVPSKMMIAAAHQIAEVHRVPEFGGTAQVQPDWSVVAAGSATRPPTTGTTPQRSTGSRSRASGSSAAMAG